MVTILLFNDKNNMNNTGKQIQMRNYAALIRIL